MNSPVLKNPEHLEVAALQSFYASLGFIGQNEKLIWSGGYSFRQNFIVVADNLESSLAVLSFVLDDEKIIVRAFRDWFETTLRQFAPKLQGFFTFDVLQFEAGDAPWSWSDFSALLLAHAAKLEVGERRLIQFGSLFGVLQRRTQADTGRIESKLDFDICKPSVEAQMRWMKKQLKGNTAQKIVFRDISRTANVDPNEFLSSLRDLQKSAPCATLWYWHPASKRCLRAV